MYRQAMIAGSLFAALAVILGAFGAHALKEVLTDAQLVTFETGVRYQFYHAIALLVTGLAAPHITIKKARITSWLFVIGILLFSGSLYILTALKANGQVGLGGFGLLTPIGGVFFIVAWMNLSLSFFKKK